MSELGWIILVVGVAGAVLNLLPDDLFEKPEPHKES